MRIAISDRGFRFLTHPTYLDDKVTSRLASESSAVGDHPDAVERPGSSFLWVGQDHHLSREEVAKLVAAMQHWLETGRLPEGV